MRLLWARIGVPYSPATGLPIESQTVSQMVDRVLALPEGTRIYVLAPVVRGRKGEYRKELAEFLQQGLPAREDRRRLLRDRRGAGRSTRNSPTTSTWWSTASWCAPTSARGWRIRSSSASSSPTASRWSSLPTRKATGAAANRGRNANAERLIFSEKFACPVSGFTIPEIEPRLFSFNNPFGACPECGGLGVEQHIDADLVIPDKRRARLRKGAIAPWAKSSSPYYIADAARRSASTTASRSTPNGRTCRRRRRTRSSTAPARTTIKFVYDDGLRGYDDQEAVRGRDHQSGAALQGNRERLGARGDRQKYFTDVPCDACNGDAAQARSAVRQDRRPAHRRGRRHVGQARRRMVHARCREQLNAKQNEIARARAQGNPRAAEIPGRCRPRLSHARRAPPARCRAARASASGSPRRSAPASPACSTCSTSRRSACTSATMRGCSKR